MGKSPRFRVQGGFHPFLSVRSFGHELIGMTPFLWEPAPTYGSWNDGASVGLHSRMADFISNHYEFGDRPVQPVDHVKVTKSFGPRTIQTPFYWFPFQGVTEWTFFMDGAFWQGPGLHDLELVCPNPPESVMTEHARKFVKESLTQFPTEISMANTLLELKEIPAMLDLLKDAHDYLDALYRNPRGLSVQTVNNLYLGYNFGVAPVISDLIAIDGLYKKVHGRLEHLRRTKGKYTRIGSVSHFSKTRNTTYHTYSGFALDEWVRLVLVNSDYEIRTTCKVRNDLAWVDSWEGIVRGLVGAMGLDNPLAVLWEATPWSWAIDYVVPVGDWLETLKFQDVSAWRVIRMTTSIKAKHTVRVMLKPRHEDERPLGEFELTRYTRNIGMPPTFGGITAPNNKQLSLFAAAAIGRNG